MRCARKDCSHRLEATLHPILLLRVTTTTSPAVAVIPLPMCIDCAVTHTDVDEYVADEAWDTIASSFSAIGYAKPVKAASEVDFIDIPNGPLVGEPQLRKAALLALTVHKEGTSS